MTLQFFKTHFLLLLLFLCSIPSMFAQQGIGTNVPNPNAVLDLTSPDSDKGFLAPRVTLTSSNTFFTGVTASANDTGLLVFNTSTTSSTASGLQGSGFYYWNGTYWGKFISSTESSLVTILACHAVTVSGTLTSGNAANITVTLPYHGGVGSSYTGGTVFSSEAGVSGLSATLQPGTLKNGTGELVFTVTGTPSNAGDAYFGIDFGGDSCVISISVKDPPAGGVTATFNSAPSDAVVAMLQDNPMETGKNLISPSLAFEDPKTRYKITNMEAVPK